MASQPDTLGDRIIQVVYHPHGPSRHHSADQFCANCYCRKSDTPVWRRNDGRRLCNKCGLRASRTQKKSGSISGANRRSSRSEGIGKRVRTSGRAIRKASTPPNGESETLISATQQQQSAQAIATRGLGRGENVLFTAAQWAPCDTVIAFSSSSEYDPGATISQFLPSNTTSIPLISESSSWGAACYNSNTQDVDFRTAQDTGLDAWDPFTISGLPLHEHAGNIQDAQIDADLVHFLPPCVPNHIYTLFPDWVGWYYRFYQRTTEVHGNALRMGLSIYVATETFIYDYAGEAHKLTAYAVLKEQYDTTDSPYHGSSSTSEAAPHDLNFGFVTVPVSGYPGELDDWLDANGQSLASHIQSPRIMSAIWDLSSLPAGPHHSDSETFRYLTRSLHQIETSSGLHSVPMIKSGSAVHEFRSVHQMVILFKHIRIDRNSRLRILMELAPKLRSACVRSCQEWLIAVFDEAAKRGGMQAQLDFLEANKVYMWNIIGHHRRSYQEANVDEISLVDRCPCSLGEFSPFDVLMSCARSTLDAIFSIGDTLHYLCLPPPRFPTHDQLENVAIVGDVLYKMYFACNLLSDQQRILHNNATWKNFAEERTQLFRRSNAKLIWNYLPVETIKVASAKLDHALALSQSID